MRRHGGSGRGWHTRVHVGDRDHLYIGWHTEGDYKSSVRLTLCCSSILLRHDLSQCTVDLDEKRRTGNDHPTT